MLSAEGCALSKSSSKFSPSEAIILPPKKLLLYQVSEVCIYAIYPLFYPAPIVLRPEIPTKKLLSTHPFFLKKYCISRSISAPQINAHFQYFFRSFKFLSPTTKKKYYRTSIKVIQTFPIFSTDLVFF